MITQHFPDIAADAARSQMDQGFVAFVGDGTHVLRTPGLSQIEAVRIGGQDAPIVISEATMASLAENAAAESVDHQMFDLRKDDDGAYLVRSVRSNDGIWQAGMTVLVKGKFDSKAGSNKG